MRIKTLCAFLIGTGVLWGNFGQTIPTQPALRYTVVDLGPMPPPSSPVLPIYSCIAGINDRGQVVGAFPSSDREPHAFLWEQGAKRDLGTLAPSGRGIFSHPFGINARGQIVGYSVKEILAPSGTEEERMVLSGFVWENGRMQEITPPTPDHYLATAINDRGQVLLNTQSVKKLAWLWDEGKSYPLGQLGKLGSFAAALNQSGQIVGWSWSARRGVERPHAFLWQYGRMHNLTPLSWSDSYAYGLNKQGQVVGWATMERGARRAFLWENDRMHRLGTLPDLPWSMAHAINDRGQIVGEAAEIITGESQFSLPEEPFCLWGRAFLYEQGKMLDLNTLLPKDSGWELKNATGINNKGQIVGSGLYQGEPHAYLLDPVKP